MKGNETLRYFIFILNHTEDSSQDQNKRETISSNTIRRPMASFLTSFLLSVVVTSYIVLEYGNVLYGTI